MRLIANLGQLTTASHNEVVLTAGSLGVSSLVCLLNNGDHGQTETTANLMGPFWRMNSPKTRNGDTIVRSKTPGVPIFVDCLGARQAGPAGRGRRGRRLAYLGGRASTKTRTPAQADMNLRGKFTTDAQGHIAFRSIKPAGYPIPVSGPVGALLRAQGRHNMRPAHIHFMIYKPGFKTQFSQVYSSDDPVSRDRRAVRRDAGADRPVRAARERAGAGRRRDGPVVFARSSFHRSSRAKRSLPQPPITGKASGERPTPVVWQRSS